MKAIYLVILISFLQIASGEWRYGHNPGIMIRLEKRSFYVLTRVLSKFLPAYISYDFNLTSEYEYRYKSERHGEIGPKLKFTNISQSDLNLALNEVQFDLRKAKNGDDVIYVDFPAIKHW